MEFAAPPGNTVTYVTLALTLACTLGPAVIGIILTTAWGQRHKAALQATSDALHNSQGALKTVVAAVGQARIEAAPAARVAELMREAEKKRPVKWVLTWKCAVNEWKRLGGK